MLILSIVLYVIALILFLYIIYDIVRTRRFTISDAIATLGIVITLILALGLNPPPLIPANPTEQPNSTPLTQANMTVYDSFDDLTYDGSFDQNQWRSDNDPSNYIVQKDGVLIVTPNSGLGELLDARSYYFVTLDHPTFFEADLLQSSKGILGNVQIHIGVYRNTGSENFWFSECNIDWGWANCWEWLTSEEVNYAVGGKRVDYDTWHAFRIEVDPDSMTFTYYIDGKMVGSHIPDDAEKLRNAFFVFSFGVYGERITGHIDNVRIGPMDK